jgi:two-component SAPR family response regulator
VTEHSISILVVEDDVIICEDIRNSIKRLGYQKVRTVTSGEEAIDSIRQDKPDIVFMDIVLRGELSGIDTAQMMVKEGVHVIFLSAYSDQSMRERTDALNPLGYLTKPFHSDDLKAVLEEAVEKIKIKD